MEANTWEKALDNLSQETAQADLSRDRNSMDGLGDTGRIGCYGDLAVQEVEWLWYPYIPSGKITILQGDPGAGKTTLAAHLAAYCSLGMMYQGSSRFPVTIPKGKVLFQSAEDGLADTIKPRLLKAGADDRMILYIDDSEAALELTDNRLHNALYRYHPKLVILDPLQAFLGADVDMHRANQIRPIMSYLAKLAEETNTAIVLIGHMNKRAGDKSLYRGLGSIDLTAAARSVLMMAENPKDPGERILMHIKSSLAPQGKPLRFSLSEQDGMRLEGEFEGDLESLLLADSALHERSDKVGEAAEFLTEFLANGACRSEYVLRAAKARGISNTTLRNARKRLGIKAEKRADGWYMAPPEESSALPG